VVNTIGLSKLARQIIDLEKQVSEPVKPSSPFPESEINPNELVASEDAKINIPSELQETISSNGDDIPF
jgi:hypothetical protein